MCACLPPLLQLSEAGWDGNPEFRQRVVFKITNLGLRRVAINERRKVRLLRRAGLDAGCTTNLWWRAQH